LSVLLAAVTLASLFSFHRLRQQSHTTIDVHGRLSTLASEIAVQTLLCRRYEKDMFLNIANGQSRQAYFVQWQMAFTDLQSAISAFEQAAVTEDDRRQVTIWKAESQRYEAAVQEVDRAILAGSITTPEAANLSLTPTKDAIRILTDTALTTANTKAERAEQANAQLTQTTSTRMYFVGGLGLLALLVALGWSWVLVMRLLRPIAALHHAASKLAAGDDTVRVPVHRMDELGRLSATFNTMAETIQQRARALEDHNVNLQAANARQQQLLTTIKQLSSPLLPVTNEVVVLPIVGHVDSARAQDIMTTILDGVARRRARIAIVDISGLDAIDPYVMGLLLQTVQAVGLLGAEVLLAGISAQIAQRMVQEGIQLGRVRTYRDLQMALADALTTQMITSN
jgi:anti-anti-sigma regulatory factor/HAMP domain-containing protein